MKKFFSVSTLATANDNGSCNTFSTYAQAVAFREWAIGQGYYSVSHIWS